MSQDFERLISTINEKHESWSSPIMMRGITNRNGPVEMVDICNFFLRKFSLLHANSGFAFDPGVFKSDTKNKESVMDKKNLLAKLIIERSRLAGFEMFVDHKDSHNRRRKDSVSTLVLKCKHNQVLKVGNNESIDDNEEIVETPKKRKRKNAKSTFKSTNKRNSCPFKIKVCCNAEDGLWYLIYRDLDDFEKEMKWSCSSHHNHIKINPEHIPIPIEKLKETSTDLINSCIKAGLSDTKIREVCQAHLNENQGYISVTQIEYIRSTYSDLAEQISTLKGDMSSAEKVIKLMDMLIENGAELDYCILVHSCDHEMTIRGPKGRPKKVMGANDFEINTIRESMKCNDNADVLLAIAWISGEERELIRRFPEFISADVTEKTNIEKRPLYLFTGMDGNNHLFPALHCYMPNCSGEIYQWVYEYAFPELVGKEVIEDNEFFITDGETAMYETLQNIKETSSPWSSTSLFRCIFHMFLQMWNKNIAGKESDGLEKEVMNRVKTMMEYMIYGIQKEYQLNDFMTIFEDHLKRNKSLLKNSYLHIHKLWFAMKGYRSKWARCFRQKVMDLEKMATSVSESLNASIKRTCGRKELAKNSLHNSSSKLINHSDYLCKRRER